MSIEALKDALPEYAKDLKLNLSSLASETLLTEQQRAGTFIACALASRERSVTNAIMSEFAPRLSPEALTAALLTDTILITHAALRRDFGIDRPRIAVAGLNPHAGEGGRMGHEEIEMMAPVIEALRAEGIEILGPLPADTMFHPAARARYDAAVCAYHDQALIPIKTLDFDGGVNITLGLPFVRTSPDHGTAFDIAGKGIANPASMIAAIRMAARMADARAKA